MYLLLLLIQSGLVGFAICYDGVESAIYLSASIMVYVGNRIIVAIDNIGNKA